MVSSARHHASCGTPPGATSSSIESASTPKVTEMVTTVSQKPIGTSAE